MKIIRTIHAIQRQMNKMREHGRIIGFVPTMGALHEGHLSLIRMAGRQCDIVVTSIFVNPTQFGPNEDCARYPTDPAEDIKKCKATEVHILFIPTARQIYPSGHSTELSVRKFEGILEGASRPGHFTGVATVVLKLLNMIQPHRAYFGQKDYQQTLIIRQMVRDLHLSVKIVTTPTIREPDGLAMSSRNLYLSKNERQAAPVLWKALQEGKTMAQNGMQEASKVRSVIVRRITREPLAKIDYVAVVDPKTLRKVRKISGLTLLALAVRIGKTRLIDNIIVKSR